MECRRPLERVKTAGPAIAYRFVSVFNWLKVFATLIATFGLLFIVLGRLDLADTARVVAVPLLLYGMADTADGLLGLTSKVDRMAKAVRMGEAAKPGAVGKLVLGLVTTFIGLVGFFSATSVESLSG